MLRRRDVHYTVSCGDKYNQLLTPLHFNCQNKKISAGFMCFFSLEKTGQTMSSHRQKHAYHEKDVMGCQSGSFYLKANHMHSLCMSTEREEPSPQQTPQTTLLSLVLKDRTRRKHYKIKTRRLPLNTLQISASTLTVSLHIRILRGGFCLLIVSR